MLLGKRRNTKKIREGITNTLLYIFLAIISIVWIFPFAYLIVNSFRTESTGIAGYFFPKEWGIDNYLYLFTGKDSNFMNWYTNTLIIALVVSVINTMITLLTAYALSRMRFTGRKALMKFMLILGMFPGFLGMICIYHLLDALGLVGNESSIFGLMLVYVSGTMMGYMVTKGFFDTIPKSLDEAAMIDGCNPLQTFFMVVLPILKPTAITVAILNAMWIWNDYLLPYLVIGNEYKTIRCSFQ